MNGKQARNLRNLVKSEAPGYIPVGYKQTNKRTKELVVGFDAAGKEQKVPYETFTIELGACQRKLYQKAKYLHYKFLEVA
jgi:hypothetical protein